MQPLQRMGPVLTGIAIVAVVAGGVLLLRRPGTDRASPGPIPAADSATSPPPMENPVHVVAEATPVQIDHPVLATFLDRGAAVRLPTDFAVQVPRISAEHEVRAVASLARDQREPDLVRHEALELLRRSARSELPDLVHDLLRVEDERERFRAFVTQHLGLLLHDGQTPFATDAQRSKAAGRLVELLEDRHVSVRREALLALTRTRHRAARAVVADGLRDPRWRDARDLIIRCAAELEMRTLIDQIRPLATDPDIEVRIAAIHVLGSWHDRQSLAAFEEARQSQVQRIRDAANLALKRLDQGSVPRSDGG